MKRLKSPRIVKMFDWNQYGRLSGNYEAKSQIKGLVNKHHFPYLILEFAEHKELFDYLEVCGPFSEEIARFYFAQMFDAIEYLHQNKITHRDIKPQNILLGKNFELKLADLGLASDETESGLDCIKGTVSYMAPEMLQGKTLSAQHSGKADIYSAGIVFFNMLTGCMPYSAARKSDRLFSLFVEDKEQFWKYHERLSFKGKLDKDLQELIEGMLEPNPKLRWSLQQIKECTWLHKGEVASLEQVVDEMKVREPYIKMASKYPHEERNKVTRLYMKRMKPKKSILNLGHQQIGMLIWNLSLIHICRCRRAI
eukprot:TRINITY_DN5916_c0_g1_i9.p1 TRINITY_DN5916_c0_g1~~TRINITY_DN5916_c0_g1_i9.p1  ORF type:complete len:310 (-),score=57.04 TRINITY_DN5916_c0_g1_i9:54-983(-)